MFVHAERRRWSWRLWRLCLVLFFVVCGVPVFTGCKTFADRTLRIRSALEQNNLDRALSATNAALKVRSASQIPERLKKNDALLLLDRAMVLRALADYQASSRDFEAADKALEILDFSRSTGDEIARYLFSDHVGPYKARPYEKLLLNSLNLLNYLVAHDLEDARVEARRFSVVRDYLSTHQRNEQVLADASAIGGYLAGYAFEKSGRAEEALRYYDEALQSKKLLSLAAPVRRLRRYARYSTPRLRAVAEGAGQPAVEMVPVYESPVDKGVERPAVEAVPRSSRAGGRTNPSDRSCELLIVVNYGRIPALVAKRAPLGLALVMASAYVSADFERQARHLAGQGLVTWVNYPELGRARSTYPAPSVAVDNVEQTFEEVANIDSLVRHAWNQGKGRVIAAAVTRMVTRAALGAGVGVAVGQGTDNRSLGVLAAMLMQASLAIVDKPDTRSWATLPARIGVSRVLLPAGTHRIEVAISNRRRTTEVTLRAGQWAVVDFSDLSMN